MTPNLFRIVYQGHLGSLTGSQWRKLQQEELSGGRDKMKIEEMNIEVLY